MKYLPSLRTTVNGGWARVEMLSASFGQYLAR